MEHKSKTGGESLRNQDVVNEDRMSELPEDLLVQILSSLETNCVIATSVLSKSWRCLWKMVPNIKFCSGNHKTEEHSFSEIVCRSLLSSNCPFIESFYLVDEYESEEALDVERMIEIAFARHVRKLVLDVPLNFKYEEYISIPSGLCSCNNTLEILELGSNLGTNFFRLDFPCRVGLKSLKKLQLNYVGFLEEESVCNLLCGCPSLEDLVIYRHGNFDAPTFTIAVPSLQRLTIVDTFRGKSNGGYVINAPFLKYLNIKGIGIAPRGRCFAMRREWYGFCRIENAPELVEAKIICVYELHVHNENIVVSLTSAKRLSLDFSPLEIKCPTGIIFYQLVSLELHTSKIGWSTLLARMLDSSPNLQILKLTIQADQYDRKVFVKDGGWEQPPKCVPECLLFHLETLVWTRYSWYHESDKQVATYILQNATRLKKATFYIEPIKSWQTLEEKREMLNELDSVVRASDSCHLVFESST